MDAEAGDIVKSLYPNADAYWFQWLDAILYQALQ